MSKFQQGTRVKHLPTGKIAEITSMSTLSNLPLPEPKYVAARFINVVGTEAQLIVAPEEHFEYDTTPVIGFHGEGEYEKELVRQYAGQIMAGYANSYTAIYNAEVAVIAAEVLVAQLKKRGYL
jgi:hypothetical protein